MLNPNSHDGVRVVPLGISLAGSRMFVLSGAPPAAGYPAAGADVDGMTDETWNYTDPATGNPVSVPPTQGVPAIPGLAVIVESGGAFASGANLQTDATGRAIVAGSGKVVLRALQASAAAGAFVWAVFTSGR